MEQKQEMFCFWDAKTLADTIILIIRQIVATAILIISIKKIILLWFVKVQHKLKFQSGGIKNIFIIYSLVFLWSLAQSTGNIYSIIIFFTKIYNEAEKDKINIASQSRIYSTMDFVPSFIVQTIYVFIPYIFCKNILNMIPIQLFKKHQIRLIKTIEIYQIERTIIQIALFFSMIFIQEVTDNLKIVNFLDFIFAIIDSIIITLLSILCKQWYIKKVQENINLSSYYLVIVSTILKPTIDIIVLIILEGKNDIDVCLSEFSDHLKFSICYIIIGSLVNYIIPLFFILYLYNFKKEDIQTLIEPQADQEEFQE